MSKTVTITGAAGQIGYQLAFRIASGQLLGASQKINLNRCLKFCLLNFHMCY